MTSIDLQSDYDGSASETRVAKYMLYLAPVTRLLDNVRSCYHILSLPVHIMTAFLVARPSTRIISISWEGTRIVH